MAEKDSTVHTTHFVEFGCKDCKTRHIYEGGYRVTGIFFRETEDGGAAVRLINEPGAATDFDRCQVVVNAIYALSDLLLSDYESKEAEKKSENVVKLHGGPSDGSMEEEDVATLQKIRQVAKDHLEKLEDEDETVEEEVKPANGDSQERTTCPKCGNRTMVAIDPPDVMTRQCLKCGFCLPEGG